MSMHSGLTATPIAPQDLRRSLGCFPTGVAIVTTTAPDGAPIGLTISSFNSVSMDPPLILWSLALTAASLETFRANPHFAVNVLSAEQADLPRIFCSPVAERFDAVPWGPGRTGAPILSEAAAHFECKVYNRFDGGDHEIIVGEVLDLSASDRTPLVYGKGQLGPLT